MAVRKQTPDVLGELMSEATTADVGVERRATRAQSAPTAVPATASQTVAWEYLEVVFRDFRGYRPRYSNRVELPNWKELPPLHDYLNQLGADGWELISMSAAYRWEKEAYFKRLIRSPRPAQR